MTRPVALSVETGKSTFVMATRPKARALPLCRATVNGMNDIPHLAEPAWGIDIELRYQT
jgi:hypothetical protein